MKANLDELKGLKRWYGDQPQRVRLATGAMLNSFAFGTRTAAIREIGDSMIVRNKKFVSGRMRVNKANVRSPVPRQKSATGSVAKDRFTGWKEQEFGSKQLRTRFATKAGRNNNNRKQIRHIVRLKARNKVLTADDYGMKSNHTPGQFMAAALRKKETKLIRIGGKLMKRRRKKFETVQVLRRPKQPKRHRWLLTARNNYFRRTNLDALWRRHYAATLRPPPKR